MSHRLTSAQVWAEIEKNTFGVLGMVTAGHEARTVGMVYVVEGRKLYMGAQPGAWKTRHVSQNPHVSMTIPIARRVPFLPWIKVPATTITFPGMARVLQETEVSEAVLRRLYRHEEGREDWCAIEMTPEGHFVTYGVAMSVLQMRYPDKSRARVPVEDTSSLYGVPA